MNRTIMTMAAVSALAIGAPAISQTANANWSNRVGNLQTQIQAGVQAGTITSAEAQPLREQYRLLNQMERQYSRDGLTRTERQDLQNRIQTLRNQIRLAARNDATRYRAAASTMIDVNRDGWDDRDTNRNGRLESAEVRYTASGFVDVNRDGWDDRDVNRDGQLDGVYAQGGPYEAVPVCRAPTGIGGVISSVLGRTNENCTLQVGQRASANLYGVPVNLRTQYRDGSGVYYRSDGQNIYQIDARTQVVTRVIDLP